MTSLRLVYGFYREIICDIKRDINNDFVYASCVTEKTDKLGESTRSQQSKEGFTEYLLYPRYSVPFYNG